MVRKIVIVSKLFFSQFSILGSLEMVAITLLTLQCVYVSLLLIFSIRPSSPAHLVNSQEMAESAGVPKQEADAGEWRGRPAVLRG